MKNNIYIVLFLTSLFLCACQSSGKKTTGENTNQENIAIQQQPQDLLAGISKAVCYSGFRSGQHPNRGEGAKNPSDSEILQDLQILSPDFKLIRLYDSGENSESVLKIISENKLDIKVYLGIWLKAELSNHEGCAWLTEPIPQETLAKNKIDNAGEINRAIRLANEYPQIVAAINVGNEALVDWNDHMMQVDTVISYVRQIKEAVKQPITVADNYEWWAAHGQKLAKELDFISVHVYPVWEQKDIDEGLIYSIANIQKVRNALPESKIVISEAGWASVASEFGERATEEKQKQYVDQLLEWSAKMNITTFIFEAFDEDWKGDPNNSMGAEKHWGLYNIDRSPKKVMQ